MHVPKGFAVCYIAQHSSYHLFGDLPGEAMLCVLWLLLHFAQQMMLWHFECVCCSAPQQLRTLLRHLAWELWRD